MNEMKKSRLFRTEYFQKTHGTETNNIRAPITPYVISTMKILNIMNFNTHGWKNSLNLLIVYLRILVPSKYTFF